MKKSLILFSLLLTFIIPVQAVLADTACQFHDGYGYRGWGMMGGVWPMMTGGFTGGWLLMIMVWLLAIIGTIALVKWLLGAKVSQDNASAILKDRLAKGEISQSEYQKISEELKK